MAAASKRIGRLKRIDRAAVFVITLGGIAVVVAVLGILVFVVSEAVPLFRAASLTADRPLTAGSNGDATTLLVASADEYRRYLFAIESSGTVGFYDWSSGALVQSLPVPEIGAALVTSASRNAVGRFLAAGLSDGRVSLMQAMFRPEYEGQALKTLAIDLRSRGVAAFEGGRAIRQVAYDELDGRKFVAALVADQEIAYWWTDAEGAEHRATVRIGAPQGAAVGNDPLHRVTHVRIGRAGALLAGTDRGSVLHWELGDEPQLTDTVEVSTQPITALEWMLGGRSWVAAAADRSLSGWFRASGEDGRDHLVRAHTFEPQAAPVVAIAISARERSFATLGRDGQIVLRHQTSERWLTDVAPAGPPGTLFITPKADSVVAVQGRTVHRYELDNPHPETSWKTLLGKVWYEGYPEPEYVWQSTGATEDFEPKFSLVPLIFGTIKGTLYAMLFAVPLAVMGALYTAQFADPTIRAKIKPTVEIMAALPSVVIGFLAGLYLAAVVERNLVAVLLMLPLIPIAGIAGMYLWRVLPVRLVSGVRPGAEILLIVPLLLATVGLAIWLGPRVEAALFTGDARLWLKSALGLTYDQRNCLVVGIAMGFAIIPIIFTISEDAFFSVPSSLTAASLALGASRWQTAVRIVLPTASPGIFSAIMVGFGRAVGETMIVLMATGNTPVMDWSIFNGIRTLSANIAVEIPEAAHSSTLYRTLFLAAALLFAMTFIVNTIAELIRQRLRERYRAA
jgi:phosphate transport system permease protein